MTDYSALDRRALEVAAEVIKQVRADQLDRRTPCASWSLGELLAHMIGQNYGFAAAAQGELDDATVFALRPVREDAGAEFKASSEVVVGAFADEVAQAGSWWLPEVGTTQLIPATTAMSFHFVDNVVHGWDVAAAIGVPIEFEDDILSAALEVALRVPGGDGRTRDGAAFAPVLDSTDDAATLDQVLLQLGRSPAWPD